MEIDELRKNNPGILPVPPGTKRPLWSVMIPTYNPGKYFEEAVNSVLIQDPGEEEMQIEVVDDCSNKVDVERIVKETWGVRVKYHRLPKNVGHSFNFTESIRRSKGELIHILHDDDRVKEGFYAKFRNIFDEYKDIGAAFCRQEYIDEDGTVKFQSDLEMEERGILDDALIKLAQKQRIQYCAMAVRRKVFEQIGGFVAKNIGCEDWEMWVRIASQFPVAYEPEALAEYRVHHGTSMTLKDMRSGQDMRFMREAIGIFNEYLPKEKRAEAAQYRRKYYGDYSFKNAKRLLEEFEDNEGASAQLSETIKIDPELLFANAEYLKGIKAPVDSAGVSVIVCTRNNEDLIERTIRHLIIQKVPEYIPWEIIVADNASVDKTIEIIEETWEKYRGKTPLKILRLDSCGLLEARNAAIESAKYNFILFCNPGDLLYRNYVHMVSVNMMRDRDLGVLGGYTESVTRENAPPWFNDWSNYCYQIGEQFEYTSAVTWTRGYVWGSGMAIKKEAWKSLYERNFSSSFHGSNIDTAKFGIDNELCYSLRLCGWSLWYSIDLKLKRMISDSELNWRNLREIWKQYGINFVRLYDYIHAGSDEHQIEDFGKLREKIQHRKLISDSCRKLRRFKRWKLKSYRQSLKGDSDALLIEYKFAKLRELLEQVGSYNKRLRLLRRASRKKDLTYLKHVLAKPYFRFPQYKKSSDKRGITVVLNYTNSSYNLLLRSLNKISSQKLPEDFPWEVIVVSNFIKDEVKHEIYRSWERSNCPATLRMIEEGIVKPENVRDAAVNNSKYEYLIFLSEFDMINPDYVRIAYKVIHNNKKAGIAGGQTALASDVKPPKWFGNYRELFGIGKQAEHSGDITLTKGHLWNTGIVARKKAVRELVNVASEFKLFETSHESAALPFNSELSAKIKLMGWTIHYESRLKSQRYVSVKQLSWEYLRKLFFLKGTEEVQESVLQNALGNHDGAESGKSWIYNAKDTLIDLNKYSFSKIFSKESEYRNDTDVLQIEKLKGKFKELVKVKNKHENISVNLKNRLNGNGTSNPAYSLNGSSKILPGVSVVICCFNSTELLPETLRYIFNQKVPEHIPWEVIIVDNASTDKTSEKAQEIWDAHNCLVPFRIVKEAQPGLSAARQKGFHTAKYDYVVFCDDDNWLQEDYVKYVFEIMSSHPEAGVLGGQSKAEFEIIEPKWFEDWKNSYAIGRQSDEDGDITYSRGYIWGAAMCVRKEAWDNLLSKGFRSLLTDRKGNSLSAGGDTEICYALRNEGWKIRYDHRLKFKHFISEKRLNWNYLRKLFRGFGQASPGLDQYSIIDPKEAKEKIVRPEVYSVRKELHKALKILNESRYRKLLADNNDRTGENDIPMLEYCLGRIEGLLKFKGSYNRGLKTLKRTARKKDHKYLNSVIGSYYKKYPRYRTVKKLNGVSVIVCTYNGEERLSDTVRHIAKQKTDKRLLWELIIVDNASTDNTKQVCVNEWNKHDVNAKLVIVDEFTQGLSAARQKGFDTAKYEYIVLCDDDNWLDEKFVQTTYDIMSSNDNIGILGGPNEALCELEPPEWFKWFQQGYAAGTQADLATGKVIEGNITWKRGFVWGAGMIVRKKALRELYAKGFKSMMSDRKGTKLTSGGDSELCFALVLSGWEVWYDTRLKLKHCMPAGRVTWEYLIRLFQGFGITSVGLDLYEKTIRSTRADVDPAEIIKQNWKYEYRKTLKEVRKYGLRRLLSLRFSQDNRTDVPMLEYYIARLKELRRTKDDYDTNLEAILKAGWRAEAKKLKSAHRKFIETENDFRYGWPWGKEPALKVAEHKTYPKISILSPSFNSVNTIEKAILSVLKQGYPNFEHIIFDGGSTDGTIEILKKYPHLTWVSEQDNGQCDAMNKAFAKSTGDIIAYLNTDDYFQRGVFEKIAKTFENNPSADMVVGNLYFEYDDHTFIRKPEAEYKKIMLPFRYIFPINPVSYFYKRKVQEEAGPFPLDNHYTMDYWFLLRAYQTHKIVKIEEYLGTFCMNGFSKTSGADNRKNTHYRALEHCWKHDRKNLPYYLYNYYKFFYYEEQLFNLRKISYIFRKNASRIYSVLTLKKNKYYSEKLYQSARSRYYMNKRFDSFMRLTASYVIYPKGLTKRSRQSLTVYSILGSKKSEKAKLAYFFLTTPPGLPLANKLYYYGNEFKKEKRAFKGNSLLLFTYLISPKFLFKRSKHHENQQGTLRSRSLFYLLNPIHWPKRILDYFRYNKYRYYSDYYFNRAGEKFNLHKNIQATLFILRSFIVYPYSIKKKSRLNLLSYSAFGQNLTDKFRFAYHLYKDNPENSFAHKINYYGNELRKEGASAKGNLIMIISYILSPKYIARREKIVKSKAVYVSQFIEEKKRLSIDPSKWANSSMNQLRQLKYRKGSLRKILRNSKEMSIYRVKSVYYYFRYRKYKAKSKQLYALAIENYNNNKKLETIKYLIPSYLFYPVSIFNRNKLSLIKNSILGNSGKSSGKNQSGEKKSESENTLP